MASGKIFRRALLICMLLGSLVLLVKTYWYPLTVSKSAQEDDVRVAVLQHILDENLGYCGSGGAVCCVSLFRIGDPTDIFLARLHGRFRKGSDCAVQKDSVPIEIKTGKHATMLEIEPVQRIGLFPDHVDVGFYCGNMCGQGVVFELQHIWNGWVVQHRVGWVS